MVLGREANRLFERPGGGYYKLYVMDLNGENETVIPLPTDERREVYNIRWSPDGQRLTYLIMSLIHERSNYPDTLQQVDLASGDVELVFPQELVNCEQHAWAREGEYIAAICSNSIESKDWEIYLIDVAAQRLKITNLASEEPEPLEKENVAQKATVQLPDSAFRW